MSASNIIIVCVLLMLIVLNFDDENSVRITR